MRYIKCMVGAVYAIYDIERNLLALWDSHIESKAERDARFNKLMQGEGPGICCWEQNRGRYIHIDENEQEKHDMKVGDIVYLYSSFGNTKSNPNNMIGIICGNHKLGSILYTKVRWLNGYSNVYQKSQLALATKEMMDMPVNILIGHDDIVKEYTIKAKHALELECAIHNIEIPIYSLSTTGIEETHGDLGRILFNKFVLGKPVKEHIQSEDNKI